MSVRARLSPNCPEEEQKQNIYTFHAMKEGERLADITMTSFKDNVSLTPSRSHIGKCGSH